MAAHLHAPVAEPRQVLFRARAAQSAWRTIPVRERLLRLRQLRNRIALDPQPLLGAIRLTRTGRPDSEILISEVLPFLDAIKFLEVNAERLLRPVRPDTATRPFWLAGTELELHREPVGVALVIAPSNYPLFLPGVQTVQALAAGNAVFVKPGAEASPAMLALSNEALMAGLPQNLITILDESPEAAAEVIAAGVDKIWLTGSAATGHTLAKLASETLTPMVCELSGCDAVIVLPEADASLAARAIVFGLTLNASRTCMRPHRVLVHQDVEAPFHRELLGRLSEVKVRVNPETMMRLNALVKDARRDGATRLLGGYDAGSVTPYVLAGVSPTTSLWNADIFAPVLALNTFRNSEHAVQLHNACSYGLSVSIFGPERNARALAQRLQAGTILINDVIVPTADPRLPFSGRKQSGYGSSRGAEGLLEFTQQKALAVRRSGYRHLEPSRLADAEIFLGTIAAVHGRGLISRARGALRAATAALRRDAKFTGSDFNASF